MLIKNHSLCSPRPEYKIHTADFVFKPYVGFVPPATAPVCFFGFLKTIFFLPDQLRRILCKIRSDQVGARPFNGR